MLRPVAESGSATAQEYTCPPLNIEPGRRLAFENMLPESKLDRSDILLLLTLLSLVAAFFLNFLNPWSPPGEDAAILMRYSQHLAGGHGIVWNIGEKPVEGATDFLFMVLLAALARAGLSLEGAARFIGIVSHVLTVVLVYVAIRTQRGGTRLAASVSAAYLAVGPAIAYVSTCFGTPFFALFTCLTWYLATRIKEEGDSRFRALAFAISGLVMGLIRPEGVLLAALMLLGTLYAKGPKSSRSTLFCFGVIFLTLGGLYFLWRWHYFGYPLPNPFYKKGGGHLYWSSLEESMGNALILGGPFLLAYVLGFCSSRTAQQAAFSIIPIGGFTFLWVLMSNAMNYCMRFQYAILPVVLLSAPSLFESVREHRKLPPLMELDQRNRNIRPGLIGVVMIAALVSWGEFWGKNSRSSDFNYEVAVMLSAYGNKHYTLATSEAGLLPLYSQWRTIDTWGLNNPWVTHNGEITETYLESQRPEVIEFHASFSPVVPPSPDMMWASSKEWFEMVMTVKNYAERNHYHLVGSFGPDPHNTYYYYVRGNFPDSAAIVSQFKGLEKAWKSWGTLINFATLGAKD